MAFSRGGTSKFGTLVRGADWGLSSSTLNEIMSTILETSFFTFSGRVAGRSFPVSLRLQRYIASANSGNSSWPDFVVSESILGSQRRIDVSYGIDTPYL